MSPARTVAARVRQSHAEDVLALSLELERAREAAERGKSQSEAVRAELAEARKKDEEARQKEIVARLRAQGDVSVMREQELLRHKLQIAHRVGDANEVERLKALLSADDSLARAAKSNYGFRPGDSGTRAI